MPTRRTYLHLSALQATQKLNSHYRAQNLDPLRNPILRIQYPIRGGGHRDLPVPRRRSMRATVQARARAMHLGYDSLRQGRFSRMMAQ
jgi:hypothetical protein